jgi:TetR/AcrR family transcriptional regulator
MSTTSTVTPLRSHRLPADERRRQLIDIAMHLFSQRGFSGTTTREIAAAAAVNEAIIFRFFPCKNDLYAAILERKSSEARTDEWVTALRAAAAAGDDEGVIRSIVTRIVEHHEGDPEFLRLMLHSALEDHAFARDYRERHFAPLLAFLVEYVETRQREGRFRPGDVRALTRAILAVPIHHGMTETLIPDSTLSLGGTSPIEVYTTFILAALRAPHASGTNASSSSVR